MAIQYKLIERGKPGVKGGGKQYQRPSLVVNKTISPDEFYSMMAEKARFSKADLLAFLYAMQELLAQQLTEGNIVQTGHMGSFYPSIRYKASPGEEKIDAKNIVTRINYRAPKQMKEAMKTTSLKKVKKMKGI